MAGAVATVPPVKRAVHHLTAPRHAPKPVRAAPPARLATAARQQVDCAPGFGGPLPAVPLVTYAEPIPDEPLGYVPGGGIPPIGAVGIVGGNPDNPGNPDTPVTPVTPVPPVPGPIPEPSIWLMMIAGVGTLGAMLRRRQAAPADNRSRGSTRKGATRRAFAGGALWSGSAAVEAGDMAATVAMKSAVASAAGKAMLCVCPAAIVAGSVMTVPPLRQAVHAATIPKEAIPTFVSAPMRGLEPCIEPTTVTVAAQSVEGFPASVETRTSTAAAMAASPAPVSAPPPATLATATAPATSTGA